MHETQWRSVGRKTGGGVIGPISLWKGIFSFPSDIQITTGAPGRESGRFALPSSPVRGEGVKIEDFTEELAISSPPAIYSHPMYNSRPGEGCEVFPEERALAPPGLFFHQI